MMMNSKMLFNIFLISFLTILHGSKGADEGGSSSLNFIATPDGTRQIRDDTNFIKPVRAIRTPFRNTEISTARGFGKRNGFDFGVEKDNTFEKTQNQQVNNDDYRDELSNIGATISKPLQFSFKHLVRPKFYESSFLGLTNNDIATPIKNHRVQIRDGSLKFHMNDGNLRIGRGFGKRSGETNDNFKEMQNFRRLYQIQNNPWLLSNDDDE